MQRAPQQSPPQREQISLVLFKRSQTLISSSLSINMGMKPKGRVCGMAGTVTSSSLQPLSGGHSSGRKSFSSPGLQAQVTHGLGFPFLEKFQATMWSFPKTCTPILLHSTILIINAVVGTPKVSSDPPSPQSANVLLVLYGITMLNLTASHFFWHFLINSHFFNGKK